MNSREQRIAITSSSYSSSKIASMRFHLIMVIKKMLPGVTLIRSERRRSGSRSQGRWRAGRYCGAPDPAGEGPVAKAVGAGVGDQVVGAIR